MKKTALVTTLLAAVCLFAACSEKEGVYSPKKQISKIYESSTSIYGWLDVENNVWSYDTNTSPKALSEEWTWDGGKLSKIVFYETANVNEKSDVSDVVTFSYDGKQMTRIQGYDEYMTITYDGNNLKQAQLFDVEDNTLRATFDFVRDGKKITKINVTADMDDMDMKQARVSRIEQTLFRSILPTVGQADRAAAAVSKAMKNSGSKVNMTVSLNLTWEGDNVTKVTMSAMGASVIGTYTFDNKNNPYQNFLFGMAGLLDDGTMVFLNENNVVKSVNEMRMSFMGQEFTETDVMNYSYTYDGNWPLTQTATNDYGNESEGYSNHSETVTYFEYK